LAQHDTSGHVWQSYFLQEKGIKIMSRFLNFISNFRDNFKQWLSHSLHTVSAETLGWLAVILIHGATIPTLLALLTGLSDRTPSVDVILLMWGGLVLLFGRAVVLKDSLNIVTIGAGFIIQAVLMALILFK
jgi:hypothetical protein